MAYTFWSDVTGKKITVSNLVDAIPCSFTSNNAAVKFSNNQTSYPSSSATTHTAGLTFSAPASSSSATVTVSVQGNFNNGSYTNKAEDQITIKRALSSLTASSNRATMYTGETAQVTFTPDSTSVYGWSTTAAKATATSTGVTLASARVSGSNKFNFTAPPSISQSSATATVKISTSAGEYSTAAKECSYNITIWQAATRIYTGPSLSLYVGDQIPSSFTYSLEPAYVYNKGVSASASDTSYISSLGTSDGKLVGTARKAGVGTITLTSADGKQTATINFSITNKGAASITASPSTVTMNTGGEKTVTFTPTGCTLNAPTSGDTSKITVSNTKSGNNYSTVVKGVAATAGTNINCTGSASTGYTAPSTKTVSVVVKDITMTIS